MGSNQQSNSLIDAFLDVLAGYIVIKHQVRQYFDVVYHFLIVERVLQFEADERGKVVGFEVVDDLSFSRQEQLVDAAQKGYLQKKIVLVPFQLVYQGSYPINPSEVLVELPVL